MVFQKHFVLVSIAWRDGLLIGWREVSDGWMDGWMDGWSTGLMEEEGKIPAGTQFASKKQALRTPCEVDICRSESQNLLDLAEQRDEPQRKYEGHQP